MLTQERLMVAATLDDISLGDRFLSLPAHMTVYPWFDLPTANWLQFDDGMRDIIEQTSPPVVMGGTRALYGSGETKGVRLLDRVTPTFNLIRGFDIHAGVFRLAHVLGITIDDTYTGLNWSPHVSDTPTRTLAPDEEVELTSLAVLAKDADQGAKVVKAIYAWSNKND